MINEFQIQFAPGTVTRIDTITFQLSGNPIVVGKDYFEFVFLTNPSGSFIWDGKINFPDFSGTYIQNYLISEGYPVTYSYSTFLPLTYRGLDALFLSFGNAGSSGYSSWAFNDYHAALVQDYLESGGKVYLEGGEALGWDQAGNYGLLSLFGLQETFDGSTNPINSLQGQNRIIVAHHALIGINSMMPDEPKMLPEAEVLVVDEAHALDSVLSGIIGTTLSDRGFARIMHGLLRLDERGTYRGLLSVSPQLFSPLTALASEMELFWAAVRKEYRERQIIRDFFDPAEIALKLSASIITLITEIKAGASGLFQEDDMIELGSSVTKLRAFADGLAGFVQGSGRVGEVD